MKIESDENLDLLSNKTEVIFPFQIRQKFWVELARQTNVTCLNGYISSNIHPWRPKNWKSQSFLPVVGESLDLEVKYMYYFWKSSVS